MTALIDPAAQPDGEPDAHGGIDGTPVDEFGEIDEEWGADQRRATLERLKRNRADLVTRVADSVFLAAIDLVAAEVDPWRSLQRSA